MSIQYLDHVLGATSSVGALFMLIEQGTTFPRDLQRVGPDENRRLPQDPGCSSDRRRHMLLCPRAPRRGARRSRTCGRRTTPELSRRPGPPARRSPTRPLMATAVSSSAVAGDATPPRPRGSKEGLAAPGRQAEAPPK